MFACLYLPPRAEPAHDKGRGVRGKGQGARGASLNQLARDFSPRIETPKDGVVTLDIRGLGSLLGDARAIGEELRRAAADQGLLVHVAVAPTATAALLLAHARAGLTVVLHGEEARALAPLPLNLLSRLGSGVQTPDFRPEARPGARSGARSPESAPRQARGAPSEQRESRGGVDQLQRWGLRTLGDLAAIPAADLSERLGQDGVRWQRWARGEDAHPLVPADEEEPFEESLDLEWPIDGLEPLSFVFARLFEPLCDRLERCDRGAVTLQVKLKLVTREIHERAVQLPAPMRDARVLRTLALLDLESHPPPAAIDRVTVAVEVTEGRVLQFGLFARALPVEKLATLLARLGALMGSDRVGAPTLVDSYRPGAFAMAKFEPSRIPLIPNPKSLIPCGARMVLRRFRMPIPARVTLEQRRPARVTTDRRGFSGGRVVRCDGPWRSSGEWWKCLQRGDKDEPWDCDEWDVVLTDGAAYRISQARVHGAWSVDGLWD